jgi:hypothetical protein
MTKLASNAAALTKGSESCELEVGKSIKITCGPVPAGRYVMRAHAELADDQSQSPVVVFHCIVDGELFSSQSFTIIPGFKVLEFPLELFSKGELVVQFTVENPTTKLRVWPPVGPMLRGSSHPPMASGLLPFIDQIRAWSKRLEDSRDKEVREQGLRKISGLELPARRYVPIPRTWGELKQLVFDEIHNHIQHRPLPLAAARLTRRKVGALLESARRIIRPSESD